MSTQRRNTMPKNKSLIAEFWGFLKETKKWWLLPIILMLVIAGALVVLSQSSVISPFIYALF